MAYILKAHRSVKGYVKYTTTSQTSPQVIITMKNGENMRVAKKKKSDFQVESLVWLKREGDVFHQQ